jgi:zinc protease
MNAAPIDHRWMNRRLDGGIAWGPGGNTAAANRPGELAELRLVFELAGHDRTAARVALTALRAELAVLGPLADIEFVEASDRVTIAVRHSDDDTQAVLRELAARLPASGWLTDRAVTAATSLLRERVDRTEGDRGAAVRRRFLSGYQSVVALNIPLVRADLDRIAPVDPAVLTPRAGAIVGPRRTAEYLDLLDPLVADRRSHRVEPIQSRPARRYADDAPGAAHSSIRLGTLVPGRMDAAYPALQLAMLLLGGYPHSHLVRCLREGLGIAYAPRAGLDPTSGVALLTIEADVTPGAEAEALDAIETCVESMTAQPPSGQVLRVLAALTLGRLVMRCATKAGLATMLATAAGEDAGWLAGLPDRIRAVTPPALAETMRRWAAMPHLTRLITTAVPPQRK